ncbi:hypothetical protein ACRAWC_04385 [Leifsonia sp. L25]|uniref:hypothetical protein n=1 Tax=Leifsonia sp. L25 TaxID=3423957 RepID=UPI003D686556
MFDALLSIDVLDGPIPFTVFGLAGALFVALLARRPSLRRLRTLGLAVACGLLAAVVSWLICVRWLNLFGEGLGMGNYLWVAAAYCGVAVAAVSIGRTPRWRTVVAIVAAPVFVAAAALGINADYGLDRTLGNLLAITVPSPIKVAPSHATARRTTSRSGRTGRRRPTCRCTGRPAPHTSRARGAASTHARPASTCHRPPWWRDRLRCRWW